jgi:nucleoid-associated protein YgaU
MKNIILSAVASVMMLSLVSCGSSKVVPAPESKLDSLLTFDEANLRLADWRIRVGNLAKRDSLLQADVRSLEEKIEAEKNAVKKCNDDIYALVKSNEQGVRDYMERVGKLEGRIREMRGLDDDAFELRKNEVYDLAKEWNAIRVVEASVLPDVYDRVVRARADIASLLERKPVKKSKNYTVRSWEKYRDCLWNIAGQSDIYNDPFQWVKLWQGNSNIIRNPDIIRQGMEITVPPPGPKTTDEQKAERMYWRKKRAAQAAELKVPETPAPAVAPTNPVPPPSPAKKMDEKGEKKGN